MKHVCELCGTVAAFFVVLFGISGIAPAAKHGASNKEAEVVVYSIEDGVIPPTLVSIPMTIEPAEDCPEKVDGNVSLFLVVDGLGLSRNLAFHHPLGSDLDQLALKIVGADRFKPGTVNGNPVAVAEEVEVAMQTCLEHATRSPNGTSMLLRLRSVPDQQFTAFKKGRTTTLFADPASPQDLASGKARVYSVGDGVTAPTPIITARSVTSPKQAKATKFSGTGFASLIVDSQGMPQNIKIIRTVGHGLDEKAVEAVGRYRFIPAMKGNKPVPVKLVIEVNFKLY